MEEAKKVPATANVKSPVNGVATSRFSLLPDVCWLKIAAFLAPPDAYHLALSFKRFFDRPVEEVATAADNSKAKPPVLLATKLLRQSLLTSLSQVLKHSKANISFEALLELGQLQPSDGSPPVSLISGSTMVQACLGVVWKDSDLDIYTSCAAAPMVRSWLVEKAGCMFVGFNHKYVSVSDPLLAHNIDTDIHHVESWGSAERIFALYQSTNPRGHKTQEEYYASTVEWNGATRRYCDRIMGEDAQDPDYQIQANGPLPFDRGFASKGSIDLVVAKKPSHHTLSIGNDASAHKKAKTAPKDITPLDILEDFDLTICAASFDGRVFRVPNPHLTFARKTTMKPLQNAVVDSCLRHKISAFDLDGDRHNFLELVRTMALAVEKDMSEANLFGNHPFFNVPALPNEGTSSFDGTEVGQQTALANGTRLQLQLYDWAITLIHRLLKYQQRGIEILGAPVIDPSDAALRHFFNRDYVRQG